MQTALLSGLCVLAFALLLSQSTSAVHLDEYLDQLELVKKSQCVSTFGNCFNNEQCCNGLTCIASNEQGDSLETPGQCVKSKDLKTCRTVDDCYAALGQAADGDLAVHCTTLNAPNSAGDVTQRYCLRRATSSSVVVDDDQQSGRQANGGVGGPRKHQAYSRVLAGIAGSCQTDADCQAYAGANTRLCCQQVSQGRQGTRRICDRITAISVCIPSPKK